MLDTSGCRIDTMRRRTRTPSSSFVTRAFFHVIILCHQSLFRPQGAVVALLLSSTSLPTSHDARRSLSQQQHVGHKIVASSTTARNRRSRGGGTTASCLETRHFNLPPFSASIRDTTIDEDDDDEDEYIEGAVTGVVSSSLRTAPTTKEELLRQIMATPTNHATSRVATIDILKLVRDLEKQCPTFEDDTFLPRLAGNWELLWTTQDETSDEWNLVGPLRRWINPLENQSYSNNPLRRNSSSSRSTAAAAKDVRGRSNPVLPRPIQDRLEAMGYIDTHSVTTTEPVVRSSQSIDIQKNLVRNVVTFAIPSILEKKKSAKATLTVLVKFLPDSFDRRRINVKFDSCRVVLNEPKLDIKFPLGIIGPTGWLRTTYLDESLRITRGHKGSVFVLSRRPVSSSFDKTN